MEPVVDDLDARGLADALVANHDALVMAECRELVLAAAWADLHPAEAVQSPVMPGMERPRRYGGDGTPEAGEFAAAELALLLGVSIAAAASLVADALDLRHRLPLLWAAVSDGGVRVWQARQVARRTRACGLTLAQAREVDAATTPYLSSLPFGRYQDLLEARIITADPEAAEARRREAELDRFVVTGQSTEHGLKTLVAKATAGEVIYLIAVLDRIAEVLLHQGDTDPVAVRRSKALGILAHPTRALALLTSAAAEPAETPVVEPAETPVVEERAQRASRNHRTALPPATMYIHLTDQALRTGAGVARMEGVGPITIGQASEFLGHSHVTIQPVLDLDRDRPVDGYEVPDRLRDQLIIRQPGSAFPFSPSTSRRMDLDHTIPYTPISRGGPPGQTRIGNLGRLTRTEHRVKTHARGWRHHQPTPACTPGVHPPDTSTSSTTPARTGSPRARPQVPGRGWSAPSPACS